MSDPRDEIQETETGYLISVPVTDGTVRLAFEQVEQPKSHTLEADLTVWQESANLPPDPFSARLNIMSLSNRETYRRQLDDAFGKGGWTTILNRACGMVRHAWETRDPSCVLQDAPESMALPVLLPPFAVAGPSILFGDGGSGKTYFALAIAICVATGAPFMGEDSRVMRTLYVDYEADAATLKGRAGELATGMGLNGDRIPLDYWPAQGVSVMDLVPSLRRKVQRDNIGLLIVDSAGLAAGGEPERAETAIRYFNALAALRVPSVTIAHQTKAGDDKYPFGSIFWHNSARCTWNVKLLQEETGNVSRLGLFNRKSNNSRLAPPIGALMRWDDGAGKSVV